MKFVTVYPFLALLLIICSTTANTSSSSSNGSSEQQDDGSVVVVVTIDGDEDGIINVVEPEFVSFTIDFHEPNTTCAWDGTKCWDPHASFLNIDTHYNSKTSNHYPRLLAITEQLSPAVLRVGGSPGDRVRYEMGNTTCNDDDFYCLTKDQWDSWQELAIAANMTIAFGLNFLGNTDPETGEWDSTNAQELLEYAYSKYNGQPPISGFELGNELSTRGPKPEEVVAGFQELRSVIDQMKLPHPPFLGGPACGNGGPHNPAWIQSFFEQGGAEVLDIITYHWYGQPSTDENLPATVLTTEFMEAEIAKTKQTRDDFTAWAPGLRLWLGEGAMSALSGQHGLTDRFEDTLWYVVRLGALAANGHSGWQRQTLLGGYYSLVDHETLRPHPSWWVAVLHKRLMGTHVLNTTTTSESGVYSFAHCTRTTSTGTTTPTTAAGSGAVTVALVNIGRSERSIVFDTNTGTGSNMAGRQEQYCLTSNQLDSDFVNLNGGSNLEMADDGSIPTLEPRIMSSSSSTSSSSNDTSTVNNGTSTSMVLPGYSVCFIVLPEAANTACINSGIEAAAESSGSGTENDEEKEEKQNDKKNDEEKEEKGDAAAATTTMTTDTKVADASADTTSTIPSSTDETTVIEPTGTTASADTTSADPSSTGEAIGEGTTYADSGSVSIVGLGRTVGSVAIVVLVTITAILSI